MPDPISAAIGAGGSIISGAMGSSASSDAADAAADAQRYAADIQQQMYEQNRQDYMPYLGTGGNALAQLSSLWGLYTPQYFSGGASVPWSPGTASAEAGAAAAQRQPVDNAWQAYLGSIYGREYDTPSYAGYQEWLQRNPDYLSQVDASADASAAAPGGGSAQGGGAAPIYTPTGMAGWESSPEYQIMQDALRVAQERGARSLDRSAAAGGGLLSGAQAKALADYALGTQAGYMGGAFRDYTNQLSSLAGLGQQSTSQLGALGANAASNIGNAAVGAGNAQAAGIMGGANAWGNALNQGLYGLGQAGGWNNLFGGGGNVGGISSAGGPSIMPGIGSTPSGLTSGFGLGFI